MDAMLKKTCKILAFMQFLMVFLVQFFMQLPFSWWRQPIKK